MDRVLFVTGMHRSGTSATAGVLRQLGVYFGRERDLMPPNRFNQQGYQEHLGVVSLNDALLQHCGGWTVPRPPVRLPAGLQLTMALQRAKQVLHGLKLEGRGAPIGVKDPRLCLTLPLWAEAAYQTGLEPALLVVLRNAGDAARSLAEREHRPEAWALGLGEFYRQSLAEHQTSLDLDAGLTEYEDLMGRGCWALVGPLAGALPRFSWSLQQADEADATLRFDLMHHRTGPDV